MALSFFYRLIHRVIEALSVHRMDAVAKDAEIQVSAYVENPCPPTRKFSCP